MLKNLKKGMFPFLIAFSAISVSGSAAFYSVFGLSKLFAGASTEVIIMAGSLEFAKLVTASLLYQYWDTINKVLKYYLSLAVIILILITSMGIYGFLSAAYQETFNQLTYVDNEKKFIQQKVDFYQQDVTRYENELNQISENIDTSVAGGGRKTISTRDLRAAQARLTIEEDNRKNVNIKRDIAVDSLRKYQQKILELDNNVEVAGELGPLKYLSGLTGYPMDKIINVLLLVIIFVFDPLAVSLVIASNFAYNQAYPKKRYKKNLYEEKVEIKPNVFDKYSEDDEKRMDIIGQNGNDGEHYDSDDLNKDGVVDKNDLEALNEIRDKYPTGTDEWNRMGQEIDRLKKRISKKDNDDLTKIY